jgi:hypothetical protein
VIVHLVSAVLTDDVGQGPPAVVKLWRHSMAAVFFFFCSSICVSDVFYSPSILCSLIVNVMYVNLSLSY